MLIKSVLWFSLIEFKKKKKKLIPDLLEALWLCIFWLKFSQKSCSKWGGIVFLSTRSFALQLIKWLTVVSKTQVHQVSRCGSSLQAHKNKLADTLKEQHFLYLHHIRHWDLLFSHLTVKTHPCLHSSRNDSYLQRDKMEKVSVQTHFSDVRIIRFTCRYRGSFPL